MSTTSSDESSSAVSKSRHALLSARSIEKHYGGVHALKGVNFDIYSGEVTTLFGENGAGKSTLMKILSGVEQPTSGTLQLSGETVEFSSTVAAREHGISIIHQELNLAPNLNVRDNIFMGRELRKRSGAVDFAAERDHVRELLERLEEDIDPESFVSELRLGEQQIVEIARALSVNSRILIMDEPTSALSAAEVNVLFKIIRDLTAAGVSIVYISHHLEEALEISDVAVVLRDGAMVASSDAADVDMNWVVAKMVGRDFDTGQPPEESNFGDHVLSVDRLTVPDPTDRKRLAVDNVSLGLRRGEIVSIYGLMGAGRTELLEAMAGRLPIDSGDVWMDERSVGGHSLAARLTRGLALVPEDRQRDGLVPTLSVGDNMSLATLRSYQQALLLRKNPERRAIDKGIDTVSVKTDGHDAPIWSLSGGNQQKVVIGKILLTDPKVILLDEPTRGIDIGAKTEVFDILKDLAEQGVAVLFATSEIDETFGIPNRILVMRRGAIAADFDAAEATKEGVMGASGESTDVLDGQTQRANGSNR